MKYRCLAAIVVFCLTGCVSTREYRDGPFSYGFFQASEKPLDPEDPYIDGYKTRNCRASLDPSVLCTEYYGGARIIMIMVAEPIPTDGLLKWLSSKIERAGVAVLDSGASDMKFGQAYWVTFRDRNSYGGSIITNRWGKSYALSIEQLGVSVTEQSLVDTLTDVKFSK